MYSHVILIPFFLEGGGKFNHALGYCVLNIINHKIAHGNLTFVEEPCSVNVSVVVSRPWNICQFLYLFCSRNSKLVFHIISMPAENSYNEMTKLLTWVVFAWPTYLARIAVAIDVAVVFINSWDVCQSVAAKTGSNRNGCIRFVSIAAVNDTVIHTGRPVIISKYILPVSTDRVAACKA